MGDIDHCFLALTIKILDSKTFAVADNGMRNLTLISLIFLEDEKRTEQDVTQFSMNEHENELEHCELLRSWNGLLIKVYQVTTNVRKVIRTIELRRIRGRSSWIISKLDES